MTALQRAPCLARAFAIRTPGKIPPAQPRPLHAPAEDDAAAAARSARILVVEDDFLVALELEHRLADAGYEVVGVAATAAEAIEMAKAEAPQLAIMDIRLAGDRDGIDAAIELCAEFGIRSIFATANSDPLTRERAQRASPVAWLQKPYSIGRLIELIDAALRGDA